MNKYKTLLLPNGKIRIIKEEVLEEWKQKTTYKQTS